MTQGLSPPLHTSLPLKHRTTGLDVGTSATMTKSEFSDSKSSRGVGAGGRGRSGGGRSRSGGGEGMSGGGHERCWHDRRGDDRRHRWARHGQRKVAGDGGARSRVLVRMRRLLGQGQDVCHIVHVTHVIILLLRIVFKIRFQIIQYGCIIILTWFVTNVIYDA